MSSEDENWSCSLCSFSNHPELMFCEMCEGPRCTVENEISKATISVNTDAYCAMVSNTVDNTTWTVEKTLFQMDDCSCTSGILELLTTVLVKDRTLHAVSWPYCSHFSQRNSFGASWSCGYRNIQMISSALMQIPAYREKLYSGKGRMPNIRIIQQWIEEAWKEGFDKEGCNHFGGKIVDTKDWIGTTECCALLRYFGIRAHIVDFHPHDYEIRTNISNNKRKRDDTQNSGNSDMNDTNGASSKTGVKAESQVIHSHIGLWLKNYYQSSVSSGSGSPETGLNSNFSCSSSSSSASGGSASMSTEKRFLPPLYFQHEGHSRTIVGVAMEGNEVDALVLDPACSGQLIVKNLKESVQSVRGAKKWQRQIRRPMDRFTKAAYQILYIEEGFMSREERERSKVIEGVSFSNQFY